jgi:hypothetical protein
MLQPIIVFLLSTVFAVLATATLAMTADAYRWCCVHGWALAHGSGLGVLLGFGLVGFHVVSGIGARFGYLRSSWPLGLPAHFAYLGSALGTVGFLRFADEFMWIGLIAGILAGVWKLRGHSVRQFGLVVASLVVSFLSVAWWGYMTWRFWPPRAHS